MEERTIAHSFIYLHTYDFPIAAQPRFLRVPQGPHNEYTIRLSTYFERLHSLLGSGHDCQYVHLVNYSPRGAESNFRICTKPR